LLSVWTSIVEGAVEDQAAFFEHEEGGVGVGPGLWADELGDHVAFKRGRSSPFGRDIEAVGAEGESVLQAVGDEDGRGAVDVALLHDQLDDGGGGDGVEAAGGRVVEHELGLMDEGAGDGDATPHAAGEAAGKEREGLVELDKFERLVDAASISSSGTRSWMSW
jgi:hypothetical protein